MPPEACEARGPAGGSPRHREPPIFANPGYGGIQNDKGGKPCIGLYIGEYWRLPALHELITWHSETPTPGGRGAPGWPGTPSAAAASELPSRDTPELSMPYKRARLLVASRQQLRVLVRWASFGAKGPNIHQLLPICCCFAAWGRRPALTTDTVNYLLSPKICRIMVGLKFGVLRTGRMHFWVVGRIDFSSFACARTRSGRRPVPDSY